MMVEFTGIKRGSVFSPNHRGNDSAIFNLTVQELEKLGCKVNSFTEEGFLIGEVEEKNHIFSMARNKQLVHKLQKMERHGAFIMNSAYGVEQCFRSNMTNALIDAGVPYPKSRIVDTQKDARLHFEALGGRNFWIKRGDFHAIHKEDVTFVPTIEQGEEMLKEFELRGIAEAVISEHLTGDLVKFYAIRGTGFFYWFYPFDVNHIKFDNEHVNGKTHYHLFDVDVLKAYANNAAAALNVHIYGGDAIVSPNGSMHIIDLNDWPSFAPCRDAAAPHIAQCIFQELVKKEKQEKTVFKK